MYYLKKNVIERFFPKVFALDSELLKQQPSVDDDHLLEFSFKQGVTCNLIAILTMFYTDNISIYPLCLYLRQIIENISLFEYLQNKTDKDVIYLFKKENFYVELGNFPMEILDRMVKFDEILSHQNEIKDAYISKLNELNIKQSKYQNSGDYLKSKDLKIQSIVQEQSIIGDESYNVYTFLSYFVHGLIVPETYESMVNIEIKRITEDIIRKSIKFLNLDNITKSPKEYSLSLKSRSFIEKESFDYRSNFPEVDKILNNTLSEIARVYHDDVPECVISCFKPFVTYCAYFQFINDHKDENIYDKLLSFSEEFLGAYFNNKTLSERHMISLISTQSISAFEKDFVSNFHDTFLEFLYNTSGDFSHGVGYSYNSSPGYFDILYKLVFITSEFLIKNIYNFENINQC